MAKLHGTLVSSLEVPKSHLPTFFEINGRGKQFLPRESEERLSDGLRKSLGLGTPPPKIDLRLVIDHKDGHNKAPALHRFRKASGCTRCLCGGVRSMPPGNNCPLLEAESHGLQEFQCGNGWRFSIEESHWRDLRLRQSPFFLTLYNSIYAIYVL